MSYGARLGRAIFWGQAGRVAEAVVFFLFYLFLARALGPASYGLFALGMSLAGVCVFLTLLGLGPETLGRFVPEIAAGGRRDRARRLLGILFAIRSAAVLAASALVFVFRRTLAERFHFPLLSESLALVLLVFAARSAFDLLTYFSAGLLELRRVAAAKLIASLAAPGLFLILWLRHVPSVNAAWLAIAVGSLAGIVVLAVPLLISDSAASARVQEALPLGRILAFGLLAWATNFFLYVLGDNMDVLLLGWLVADRSAIGYYAVGAKIVFSLTGLLLGWASLVSVPSFFVSWQQGGVAHLARLVEAQWKFAVLCLVGPFVFLIRYAREVIAIFYAPAYSSSVAVVQILSGFTACAVVLGFSLGTSALYATSRERMACALIAAAAVFNVLAEIVLVRRMGVLGAAYATGMSFVLLAVLSAAASRLYIPWRFPAIFVAKVVGAAAIATVPTIWFRPSSFLALLVGSVVWSVAFLAALALFKPLDQADSAALVRVNPHLRELAAVFSPQPAAVAGGTPWQA